jgi:CelD/BcsL family acetyltransferase involved in cellulose biosynthesis
VELSLYRDDNGFAVLRSQWNQLLARSRSDNLFLTWEWQTTWWRCLGEGELWLLAWHDAGDLVAIAPLYLTIDDDGLRHFSLVGCIEVSDYLDLIIAAGHEDAVYQALLAWLHSPAAPAWDRMTLCNLPQDSPTHRRLPEVAAANGVTCVTSVEDVCPIVELPGDWEIFLEERVSKKQRHEVRRKLRKIEREAQYHWRLVDNQADLAAEMASFIDLHRASTQEKHSFMTPDMQAFFAEMTQVMHAAGWLHLSFLEINGDRAAAMLGFVYKDRILIYNSGYKPDAYAELSPGIVLTSHVIQDAIHRGLRVFDFLQGNEVYKYRFGAVDTLVYRTYIERARTAPAS